MRLSPIDEPKSLLLKLAFYLSRKKFGKVLAPLRFIYSRSTPIMMASLKISSTEKKLHLPMKMKLLIRYFTSHLNECRFCSDLSAYAAQKGNFEFQELNELMNYRSSNKFTEKEKSLFAFLEEVNLTKTATDKTFEDLQKFFTDQEIVEITWINATENYFNLLTKPLGLTSDELNYKV